MEREQNFAADQIKIYAYGFNKLAKTAAENGRWLMHHSHLV